MSNESWDRGGRYHIWFNSMFEFCRKMIQFYICFNIAPSKSIQINSGDSIQNIIQFNSQKIIDSGRIRKVPKGCQISTQKLSKIDKKEAFYQNLKILIKYHCCFGCSWGFEDLHCKIELNTFIGKIEWFYKKPESSEPYFWAHEVCPWRWLR